MTQSAQINLVRQGQCPACLNKSNLKRLYQLEKFEVFECSCKTRFIDPSLDGASMMAIYQNSETLKLVNPALESYYEYETLNPESLTYRDYKQALEQVATHAPGKKLLEVGCGSGTFLKFARTLGWEVYGVDSSPENKASLEKENIPGVASGYLEYETQDRFDVIVLWDLIEHPQDPGAFLKKSHELLNPKGILLLATPQYPNILSLLAGFFYQISGGKIRKPCEKMYMLEHTSYFGIKSLETMCQKHHFKLIEAWKTETDLKRYRFGMLTRLVLNISFFLARLLNLQNRVTFIARKN